MSRQFLVHSLQQYGEALNARSLRRHIAAIYGAGSLAAATSGLAPLWSLYAVPSVGALRHIMTRALEQYLPPVVARMKRHVNCYSGTVLRCDGNYDLAARIAVQDESGAWVRPYSVLHGVCLVDGALADVPKPMATEALPDILADLSRIVPGIMEDHRAPLPPASTVAGQIPLPALARNAPPDFASS